MKRSFPSPRSRHRFLSVILTTGGCWPRRSRGKPICWSRETKTSWRSPVRLRSPSSIRAVAGIASASRRWCAVSWCRQGSFLRNTDGWIFSRRNRDAITTTNLPSSAPSRGGDRQTGHLLNVPAFLHQRLLESGYDIRTVQESLGHRDVPTTMIHTHVLHRGTSGVRSPLDRMCEPNTGRMLCRSA